MVNQYMQMYFKYLFFFRFFKIFSFLEQVDHKKLLIGHLENHVSITNWNFSVRKTLNCISLSALACHHSTLHLIEWGCNSLEILTFCLLSDIVKTFTKKLNRQRNFWLLPHLINRFNSPYWPKVFVCYFVALIFHICYDFFL